MQMPCEVVGVGDGREGPHGPVAAVGLETPGATRSGTGRTTFGDRNQFVLANFSVAQGFWAAGLDLGYLHTSEQDPFSLDQMPPKLRAAHRLAGGLHVRFGSRRIGLRASGLWPIGIAELALDVRFGLFPRRRQGGWWDPGTP